MMNRKDLYNEAVHKISTDKKEWNIVFSRLNEGRN